MKDLMHFRAENIKIIGHDSKYSLYTTPIEEEWIEINVEDRDSHSKLRTEDQDSEAYSQPAQGVPSPK